MKRSVCAILLAAGGSTRMGLDDSGTPINKLLIDLNGLDPIARCVLRFSKHADEIVIAVSDATRQAAENAAALSSVPVRIVSGGSRRQDSVLNALMSTECEIAAIHDCARCLVSDAVIEDAIETALREGSGVAAVKVRDTLRYGGTYETVPREGLYMMQTPQCFVRSELISAYAEAGDVTDDAEIWKNAYGSCALSKGSIMNQKLTEKEDIEFFLRQTGGRTDMRIGIGEDTHRLVEGRKLILGGVEIPFRLGLLGHSDADVLVHAIMDAMLGAAALGDIGRLFPDKDPEYEGISSLILLERVDALLLKNGYRVSNIDAVITAQEPKLAPYIDEMRKKTADVISNVGMDDIGIKATTPEHLGPEGNLECITVRAVACIERLV